VSKTDEIAKVTAQLDGLLDQLRDNVAAMNEILSRPPAPGGGEADERLVVP
jgi:hypothetical protein